MPATSDLHAAGQSIWIDNITRELLDNGTIQRYIDAMSVTGLTSNPSIFDKAISSGYYDESISAKAAAGLSGEALFFDIAIEDLRRAADAFLPIWEPRRRMHCAIGSASPWASRSTGRTARCSTPNA